MPNYSTGAFDSRLVRTIAMMVGLFYFTYTVAQWVITDNTTYMTLCVVGVLGVMMTMAILKDWRSGLVIFLCWLVLEDTIRKYFGNSIIIFFAKDAILGITYFSMLLARRKNQLLIFKPPFMFWLTIFFWVALAQVFNPHSPSFFFGLLGMKTYFYYVPSSAGIPSTKLALRRYPGVQIEGRALAEGMAPTAGAVGCRFLAVFVNRVWGSYRHSRSGPATW